jgi:methylenetetrahydrofolate dehydrogenase (NADP+)/methenyltetrahydrofolate cyclohydrolase
MSERPTASRLIDGRAVASRLLAEVRQRVETLRATTGTTPCLATVLVGDDPASATYVRMKRNRCKELGLDSRLVEVRATSTTAQVVDVVAGLSLDQSVHGILVQHPMPVHLDERAVSEAITPEKDVDGVTMQSFAAMAFGGEGFASCTPAGILRLLDAYEVDLEGLHAVVVGRSPILGKPAGMLLLSRNATVTYCHSRTARLDEVVADADLVVAAVGVPELIKGSWIKRGAVVIDAGYNPGNVGDVEFATAVQRARLITPVPGGVGPTTIAVLLEQTVTAAERVMELPI